MSPSTESEIRDLTRAANDLIQRIDALTGGTSDHLMALAKTAKANRRMIVVLWAGFMLDIALTILVTFGFITLGKTTDQLEELRTSDRRDALCPLYQQFINADTPTARDAARRSGQNIQRRDEAFRVIREGYESLGCREFEKQ